MYRGSSKNTSVNSKGVFEKAISLDSTSTSRRWTWTGRRFFNSQYIRDDEGRFLRYIELIRESWVSWFHKLLNTKSPTLDPTITNELKVWPPCSPLEDLPSRYEVEDVIRAMANRKVVGPDGLPVELLKVLVDRGD